MPARGRPTRRRPAPPFPPWGAPFPPPALIRLGTEAEGKRCMEWCPQRGHRRAGCSRPVGKRNAPGSRHQRSGSRSMLLLSRISLTEPGLWEWCRHGRCDRPRRRPVVPESSPTHPASTCCTSALRLLSRSEPTVGRNVRSHEADSLGWYTAGQVDESVAVVEEQPLIDAVHGPEINRPTGVVDLKEEPYFLLASTEEDPLHLRAAAAGDSRCGAHPGPIQTMPCDRLPIEQGRDVDVVRRIQHSRSIGGSEAYSSGRGGQPGPAGVEDMSFPNGSVRPWMFMPC